MKVQSPTTPAPIPAQTVEQPAAAAAAAPAAVPNLPDQPSDQASRVPGGKEKEHHLTRQALDKVVEQMNETLQVYNYDLHFEVVDKHRIVISIVNTSTGEVLKQIPPKDLMQAFKQMDEFLGMLVDRRV